MRAMLGEEPMAKQVWRGGAKGCGVAAILVAMLAAGVLPALGLVWLINPHAPSSYPGRLLPLGLDVLFAAIVYALALAAAQQKRGSSWAIAWFALVCLLAIPGVYSLIGWPFGHHPRPVHPIDWLIVGGVGLAEALLIVCVGGLVYGWIFAAQKEIMKFGSSVSTEEVFLLALAVVAIGVVLHFARPDTSISRTAGLASAAAFALGCLAVGWLPALSRRTSAFLNTPVAKLDRSYLIFALDLLGYVLSIFDYLLARVIAGIAGAAVRGRRWRFGLLMANFAGAALLLLRAEQPWCFLGALWAVLVSLGLARRWSWQEQARSLTLSSHEETPQVRDGLNHDLRELVLFALAALVVVVAPLTLEAAVHRSALFDHSAGPLHYADWLAFLGGELIKALPVVDWSEVFEIGNKAIDRPQTDAGYSVHFVLRAIIDLVVIAAIVKAFAAGARSRSLRERFQDPLDELDRLDGETEGQLLINAWVDWGVCERMKPYNEACLKALLETFASRPPEVAKGAARLAGWQLARAPLSVLIDLEAEDPAESPGLIEEMRAAAVEGLRRRANELKDMLAPATVAAVADALDLERAPSRDREAIDAALAKIERRRRIEIVSRQLAVAPDEVWSDIFRKLMDLEKLEDPGDLLKQVGSGNRDAAIAVYALGEISSPPAETEDVLIAALSSENQRLRLAATRVLGHIGGAPALEALAGRADQGADAGATLYAFAEMADRGVDRDRLIGILRSCLAKNLPDSFKDGCVDLLSELKAVAAVDDLLEIAVHGYHGGARKTLLRVLSSIDARLHALDALRNIGDPAAFQPLREMLARLRWRSGKLYRGLSAAVAQLDMQEPVASGPPTHREAALTRWDRNSVPPSDARRAVARSRAVLSQT